MIPRAAKAVASRDHPPRRVAYSRRSHTAWALLATTARTANRLGAGRRLQSRRTRLDADRAVDELRRTVAGLPAQSGPSDASGELGDSCLRTVPTLCDVSVAILSPAVGGPGMVIKIARTEESDGELRRQCDVLRVLHGDAALGQWRELLPEVLQLKESAHGGHLVGIETLLPGTTLEALLVSSTDPLARMLTPAIETIGELHDRSGRLETIESAHLRSWVDEPLERLHRSCLALAPASADAVTGLGRQLHDALLGRRALVSWTHGDFTPGNVLVEHNSRRVMGIVDWAGGRPDELAVIDQQMMLLAAVCHRERRDIGAIVTERLGEGSERGEHPSVPGLVTRSQHHDVLDDRALTLLSWLRHVTEVQRKSARYPRNRVWWALNVEPVLWHLTVRPRPTGTATRR